MSFAKSKVAAAGRAGQATGKFLRTGSEHQRQLKTALREAFLQREGLSETWTLQNEYQEKMEFLPELASGESAAAGNEDDTDLTDLEYAIGPPLLPGDSAAQVQNSAWDDRLWAIFSAIDVDGSGALDVDELGSAFAALGFAPTRQQMAYIMFKYDVDHNDTIDFEEFKQMQVELETMSTSIKKEEEKQRLIVFEALDEERKGEISFQRLEKLFQGDHTHKKDVIEMLIRKYVPEGKQTITPAIFLNMYSELLLLQQSLAVDDEQLERAWLAKLNADSWKATISHMGPHALTVQHRQNLLLIFESLEEKNSNADRLGYMTVASLARFMKAMEVDASKDQLRNLVAIYDAEKSGTICFEEFVDLCKDMAQLVKEAEVRSMPMRSLPTMSAVDEEEILEELREETPWEVQQQQPLTAAEATSSTREHLLRLHRSLSDRSVFALERAHGNMSLKGRQLDGASPEPPDMQAPPGPGPRPEQPESEAAPAKASAAPRAESKQDADTQLKTDIEDLARAAVLALPLELRTELASKAFSLVLRHWVDMSWIQRYRMFRKHDAQDEGAAAIIAALPAANAELEHKLELQAQLFRESNAGKTGIAALGKKVGKARILAAKGSDIPEALSEEEAKQRVMAYCVADRQEAAGLDAWDDALPWTEKLQLIKSIVALQQHRGSDGKAPVEPHITYESLNRHWAEGGAVAKAGDAQDGGEESVSTAIASVLFRRGHAPEKLKTKRRRHRRGRGYQRSQARLDFLGSELQQQPLSPSTRAKMVEELDETRQTRLEKLKVFKKAAVKVSTMAQIAVFAKDVHEKIVARHFRDALLKAPPPPPSAQLVLCVV